MFAALAAHRATRDPILAAQRIMEALEQDIKSEEMQDKREMAIATAVMEETIDLTVVKGMNDPRQVIDLHAIIDSVPFEKWVDEHIKEKP